MLGASKSYSQDSRYRVGFLVGRGVGRRVGLGVGGGVYFFLMQKSVLLSGVPSQPGNGSPSPL